MTNEELEAVIEIIRTGIAVSPLELTTISQEGTVMRSGTLYYIGFRYNYLGMNFDGQVNFEGDWRNLEEIIKHFKKKETEEKPENTDFVTELKKI